MKLPECIYYQYNGLHRFLFGAVKYYDWSGGGHSVRIFNIGVWAFYGDKTFFWFRIFNYGLMFKDASSGLTFSQRNGYVKVRKFRNYYVSFLKPHF